MPFFAEPIFDAKLLTQSERAHMLNALKRVEALLLREYKKTVATWNHQVQFYREITYSGGNAAVIVGTDDDAFRFVDEGTSVRYATMTKGFQPKSRPGVIGSMPGKGGVAYISKKVPRPGIKARHFTDMIEVLAEAYMVAEVNAVMGRIIVP